MKNIYDRVRECFSLITKEKQAGANEGKQRISLNIDTESFDEMVWQTETSFNEKEYNDWLKSAIGTLQKIYDDIEGLIEPSDLYILGDVINLLDGIDIKVKDGGSR